ncbi:signal recognition particle protein [Aquicella lusitana]|uniref:Signal recognition particle protein n=1 Tax=Aquicella lusitana TaxID=254246 RepID=A0A370GSC0_9COXI|nr:signal recognition particle protein [Aquicella lusitana]RDI44833.1 signal recognition particle subunit FFH/SRP54 (srp54) [Aquicella lusitana]VVC73030.1 Signal recognition particle protein [Aquicella lusitana]
MFSHLSERLNKVIKNLTGQGRLTEANIQETLREIRKALLEADVALPVAKAFIEDIQAKAVGKEVMESLTPGQVLIKLVHDELVTVMGESNETLDLKAQPPAVILMAGLQGSGKTTTVAKLARWLQQIQKKSVLVASADIYRPAAIDQLETLAKTVGAEFFPSQTSQDPIDIAKGAIQAARNKVVDVVIIDTAGRLHIDEQMMSEIQRLHAAIQPVETLFVVDSMTGQDAVNTAKAFNDALPLTGVVLTKADGDARGGAALSIRYITGKPIKFIGIGEKIDALEPFYPDRIASRILGMGDILTLVEEAERNIDKAKAEKLVKKIKKGKVFDLDDFRDQLKQIHKMGGVMGIMSKLPGVNQLPDQVKSQFNDKRLVEIEAIINSMTPKERRYPDNIKNSHKRRIALGSGTSIQAINQLLKQFAQMQKMMKKMSKKGGMMKLMRGLQGKFPFGGGGGLPPGLPF